MIAEITIIIPFLNEGATLVELLEGLSCQTLLPREVIFVDAGSTDNSVMLIQKKWSILHSAGIQYQILSKPDSYPGRARNEGIIMAQTSWIALLDAGMVPHPTWLESLHRCIQQHPFEGVYGICVFYPQGAVATAGCALTYGCEAHIPTLPGSLFHRKVFQEIGMFPENLRAGEDRIWMKRYLQHYKKRVVCHEAVVHYTHFPSTIPSIIKKYFMYTTHVAKAGLDQKQQIMLPGFLIFLLGVSVINLSWGLILATFYLIFRGILEPIRRSSRVLWWKHTPIALGIAVFLAPILDITKVLGFLKGNLFK